MKLVIPREKWERGTGVGLLWNGKTDCGCVMGHYGLALGYTKEDLAGNGQPTEVFMYDDDMACRWPTWAVREEWIDSEDDEPMYLDTRNVDLIVRVNDDEIGEQEREAELIRLFASHGVELEFV